MQADQYQLGTPEWRALAEFEHEAFDARLEEEMHAYRPAFLRERDEQ